MSALADIDSIVCKELSNFPPFGFYPKRLRYERVNTFLKLSNVKFCIPGQFKVFIDRCTPWCNTHEPHATISNGKKGYSIALRTGPNMKECNRIIESIEHFYGHLEITPSGSLGLCFIEYKEALEDRIDEIKAFCLKIK